MKPYLRIKVLIADDPVVYRDGLKLILQKNQDFEVIRATSNGKDLLFLAGQLQPNVISTTIALPQLDGIESTKIVEAFRFIYKNVSCYYKTSSKKFSQLMTANQPAENWIGDRLFLVRLSVGATHGCWKKQLLQL